MNTLRGEVPLKLSDGTYTLCLTLGALAQIESLLGCQSLDELRVRFRNLSSSELIAIVKILLIAGGTDPNQVTASWVESIPPNLASQSVADAFDAALG